MTEKEKKKGFFIKEAVSRAFIPTFNIRFESSKNQNSHNHWHRTRRRRVRVKDCANVFHLIASVHDYLFRSDHTVGHESWQTDLFPRCPKRLCGVIMCLNLHLKKPLYKYLQNLETINTNCFRLESCRWGQNLSNIPFNLRKGKMLKNLQI